MVPTVEFPPVTPFTLHVTDMLVALVTVAVKVCVAPSKTFCVVGATVTVTGGGGGGGGEPPPPPPHAALSTASASANAMAAVRRLVFRNLWRCTTKRNSFKRASPTRRLTKILS
jgi:hypothetical protein